MNPPSPVSNRSVLARGLSLFALGVALASAGPLHAQAPGAGDEIRVRIEVCAASPEALDVAQLSRLLQAELAPRRLSVITRAEADPESPFITRIVQTCDMNELHVFTAPAADSVIDLAEVDPGLKARVAALTIAALLERPPSSVVTALSPEPKPEPSSSRQAVDSERPYAPEERPDQAPLPPVGWRWLLGVDVRSYLATPWPLFGARLGAGRRGWELNAMHLFTLREIELGRVSGGVVAFSFFQRVWQSRKNPMTGWGLGAEVGTTWGRGRAAPVALRQNVREVSTGPRPYVAALAHVDFGARPSLRGALAGVRLSLGYAYGLTLRADGQSQLGTNGPFVSFTLMVGGTRVE